MSPSTSTAERASKQEVADAKRADALPMVGPRAAAIRTPGARQAGRMGRRYAVVSFF